MEKIIYILIIIAFVLADYYWFDWDSERWAWIKDKPKPIRILIVTAFLFMSFVIYFAISLKYF